MRRPRLSSGIVFFRLRASPRNDRCEFSLQSYLFLSPGGCVPVGPRRHISLFYDISSCLRTCNRQRQRTSRAEASDHCFRRIGCRNYFALASIKSLVLRKDRPSHYVALMSWEFLNLVFGIQLFYTNLVTTVLSTVPLTFPLCHDHA